MEDVIEIWKPINDYFNLYEVSNLGRIKSLNYASTKFERVMQYDKLRKYPMVGLYKNKVVKIFYVHRLVAIHFMENKENKPEVHHIDHNPSNNKSENLMWVTASENVKYKYTEGGRIGKSNMIGLFGKHNPSSVKVNRIGLNGVVLETHFGISDAARFVNGSASHIVKVCKGKLKKHKGYKWEYA